MARKQGRSQERRVEAIVEEFVGEWLRLVVRQNEAVKARDISALGSDFKMSTNIPMTGGITEAGADHLIDASEALLRRHKLQDRISGETARKAISKALADHLPKARKTGRVSEHAIVEKASAALADLPRADGLYIFPVAFAFNVKTSNVRIGPVRLLARPLFEAECGDALSPGDDATKNWRRMCEQWCELAQAFDHFLAVEVQGFESKMAWPAARQAAETMLNTLRMHFGYRAMRNVRIGDGFIFPAKRATLRLDTQGEAKISFTSGGGGTVHLDDGWQDGFNRHLRGFAWPLAQAVGYPLIGDGLRNPTRERVSYFNRLMAEAYCEPHDPIRLVRLIAALEALTLIDGEKKSFSLAIRCALAGGWGDARRSCEIFDAVREAYHWRNAVVHGDAPRDHSIRSAFHGVERYLLDIYLGLLILHIGIARAGAGQTIGSIRNEMERRLHLFWVPEY